MAEIICSLKKRGSSGGTGFQYTGYTLNGRTITYTATNSGKIYAFSSNPLSSYTSTLKINNVVVASCNNTGYINYTGSVSDGDVVALYAGSGAFASMAITK